MLADYNWLFKFPNVWKYTLSNISIKKKTWRKFLTGTVKAPVFGTLNSAISNFQTWFVRTVMEVFKILLDVGNQQHAV